MSILIPASFCTCWVLQLVDENGAGLSLQEGVVASLPGFTILHNPQVAG